MHDRLQHDYAFSLARAALDLVRGLLREEEHRDFVEEMYLVARKELARFVEALGRQEARLRPMQKDVPNSLT